MIFDLDVSTRTTFGLLNMHYSCCVIYCGHLSKRYIGISFNFIRGLGYCGGEAVNNAQ